jgi:hypothetical protein
LFGSFIALGNQILNNDLFIWKAGIHFCNPLLELLQVFNLWAARIDIDEIRCVKFVYPVVFFSIPDLLNNLSNDSFVGF